MLCGNSPYYNDDIPKMYTNIRKAKLTFPKDISDKAKSIMQVDFRILSQITEITRKRPYYKTGLQE